MPTEATCRDCHNRRADVGHPEERACAYCHTNPAAPMPYERPSRELVFSHGAHANRTHGNGASCHGVGASTATVETFAPARARHARLPRELPHRGHARAAVQQVPQQPQALRDGRVSIVRHTPGFGHHHGYRGPHAAQPLRAVPRAHVLLAVPRGRARPSGG